jgi:hypothetical protein
VGGWISHPTHDRRLWLGGGKNPSIAPGQTVVVKVFIPAPPIAGDFSYEVIVNADGSVLESNYTNNVVRESCAG